MEKRIVGFIKEQNGFANFYPFRYHDSSEERLALQDDASSTPFYYDFPQYGILPLDVGYGSVVRDFYYKPVLISYDDFLVVDNDNEKAKSDFKRKLEYHNGNGFSIKLLGDSDLGYFPIVDIKNLRLVTASDSVEHYAFDNSAENVFNAEKDFIVADVDAGIGFFCKAFIKMSKKNRGLTNQPVLRADKKYLTPDSELSVFRIDADKISEFPYDSEVQSGTYANDPVLYNMCSFYFAPEKDVEHFAEKARFTMDGEHVRLAIGAKYSMHSIKKEEIGNTIIEQVETYLTAAGRDITRHDVVNYCICLTQGFITTFSGAPGTGKTTLCRLLGEALGLSGEERYVEVSVGRGWSDIKDFIGYVPPFSTGGEDSCDGVTATNPEVCESFYSMHSNRENEPKKGLFIITLDEANLSPIEYYWSQFLRLCQIDDDAERRKIQVGKNPWYISPNLRFLATVNFDHTTEALSPRFLDRSWVIPLVAQKGNINYRIKSKPALPERAFSIIEMREAFAPNSEHFPDNIAACWKEITELFAKETIDLPISPRNIIAVEYYCIAAAQYMDAKEALDYAVLQKILPTINGYGDRFSELVSGLAEIAQRYELTRTSAYIRKMEKAASDNSNFYQFFAR